jgi:hypothetical protein
MEQMERPETMVHKSSQNSLTLKMKYIFYNPKKDNKIMGMSNDKNSMEFPYIESEQNFHSLDNLIINNKKEIEFKEGTLKVEEVTRMRQRNFGFNDLKEKLDQGKISDKEALKFILSKII